jgi:hypothetical protein
MEETNAQNAGYVLAQWIYRLLSGLFQHCEQSGYNCQISWQIRHAKGTDKDAVATRNMRCPIEIAPQRCNDLPYR